MVRRWICLLALTLPGWPFDAARSSEELLTLEDALYQALTHNPAVLNTTLSAAEVADQIEATKARRYPALKLQVRESRNFSDESFEFREGALGTVDDFPIPSRDTEIATHEKFTTHITVEARQPLAGLYRIGLDIEKLKVRDEMAHQDMRAERQETAKRVKEQYYEILETQSALEAARESIAFLRSLTELVRKKLEQKTALEYELLDTEAKLAKAEHDALKEQNTLASEKERLNELLGRDIRTPFTVTAELGTVTQPVNTSDAQALQRRPDAQEARLKLRQAEYDLDLKRASYLPEIDLSAFYNRSLNTELIPDESFYVGVVARWEFFDWGRRADEVSKARRSISKAQNDIRRVDARVQTEVNARVRDLQNARNLVGVTKKAQSAAQQKLRVTHNRYAQQSALLDDVLKAQSDLANANNDYHQAVLAVWTARANLAKAMGEE